jgi:hypothetical protein
MYQKTRITTANMSIHPISQIAMPILYRDVLYALTIVVVLMSRDMIIQWIILIYFNNPTLLNFYVQKSLGITVSYSSIFAFIG